MKKDQKIERQDFLRQLDEAHRRIAELQIIERQKNLAQERLRESEGRFHRLVDAANEGVVMHDKGKILDVNQTFADMFGYKVAELIGSDGLKLITKKDRDQTRKNIRSKHEDLYEVVGLRKDGSTFPVEICAKTIVYEGKTTRMGTVRDISPYKNIQDRLEKINRCFLDFSIDPGRNIERLITLCGESFGATCALYHRVLEAGVMLCTKEKWDSPASYEVINNIHGYVCHDVIKKASPEALVVHNLADTAYAKTDPNVAKYKLHTYVGMVVKLDGVAIGALCIVFKKEFVLTSADEKLMKTIAAAIGIEEERKRAHEGQRQNLELYRGLTKASPDGIILTDIEGSIIMINQPAAAMCRFEHKEKIIGKNIFDFVLPQETQKVRSNILKILTTESITTLEATFIRSDKTHFIAELRCSLVKNAQGRPHAILSTMRDITERKKVEETLIQEKRFSQGLINSSVDGIVAFDKECCYTIWNPAMEKITGLSSEKVLGRSAFEVFSFLKKEGDDKFFFDALAGKTTIAQKRAYYVPQTGKQGFFQGHYAPLRDNEGNIIGGIAIIRDTTKHKKVEDALKLSEANYHEIFNSVNDAIVVHDAQTGRICNVNYKMAQLMGYTVEELKNMSVADFSENKSPYTQKDALAWIEKTTKDKPQIFEWRCKNKEGKVFWVEVNLKLTTLAGQKRILAVIRDIDKRKKNQKDLLFTKFIFDHMVDAALWVDSSAGIFYVNNAACDLLGYSRAELLLMSIHEIDINFPRKNWSWRWEKMKKEKSAVVKSCFRTKSGKKIPVEISGNYMKYNGQEYLSAIVRDITDHERAEEVLRRSEQEKAMILDSVSEIVTYHDSKMKIIWANKAAEKSISSRVDELVGSNCYEVWQKRKTPCKGCPVKKAFKTGESEQAEISSADGKYWVVRGYPVKDAKGKVINMVEVALDITKRKIMAQERQSSIDKSKRILEETVIALAATAERRDPYTAGHQRRVAQLACAIAKEVGLTEYQIEGIRMAAIIHDVGKVYIPAEILSKPSKLSDLEFNIIKTHPQVGYEILEPVEFPWPVALIVFQHHEKINGSGYPKGASSKNILFEAKILAVADVVEAMASHRPYRATLGIDRALKEVTDNKGVLYDTKVVDACVRLFKKKRFRFVKTKDNASTLKPL